MFTPFLDIPVDGFTLLTSFTYAAAIQPERRWLENDRVNALRQSSLYDFKGRVVPATGQLSAMGQVRAVPASWLYAVSNSCGPGVAFWNSAGQRWTPGIPIGGPAGFQSFRNGMNQGFFIQLDEPWFLPDGILNYENHADATLCFMLCEPRPEIKGELLSACLDRKAVEF